MKKTIALIFLSALLMGGYCVFSQNVPAFPGAEGHGKYTTGGRGGRVIYVTNLEDNSSPGSLRYAINQTGSRMILFKVSGTIQLKSKLQIKNGNVTIAGQTAPGDGITVRDYPVTVDADNVIIRFMRFRMGDETEQEADALGGRYYKGIIVDHCSMSWSTDECVSFYQNENFTLQWSIISESLRISVHNKGKHGYGGIWGGEMASFHHNLLIHHDSRNPRFCGSRYSNRPDDEVVDFRNNVIYNWGANSAYGAEGGSYNLVNNYFKAGPASSNRDRIIQPYADNGSNSQPKGTYGKFYVSGNHVTASQSVTDDNWEGVDMHSSFGSYAPGTTIDDLKSESMYATGEVTTHTAEQAYDRIISYCGASLNYDSVDLRLIHDVSTGTATITDGGNGSKNGLIDTQSAVGGWPVLKTDTAPTDSDEDGMPDAWEDSKGLDKNDPDDAQLVTVDGTYPNLEVYLYSLVQDIVLAQNEGGVKTAAEKLMHEKNTIRIYFDHQYRQLSINHTVPVKSVHVYNISGRLVKSEACNQQNVQINLSELQRGVSIVEIFDAENRRFAEKIIVL